MLNSVKRLLLASALLGALALPVLAAALLAEIFGLLRKPTGQRSRLVRAGVWTIAALAIVILLDYSSARTIECHQRIAARAASILALYIEQKSLACVGVELEERGCDSGCSRVRKSTAGCPRR